MVERIPDKEDPAVKIWAHSSAVERFSDKEEVEGSTPSVPTNQPKFYYGAWVEGEIPYSVLL